jgi:hypothetical protein
MAEQAPEVDATPSLQDRIADKFVKPEQPEVEAKETTESDVEPEAVEAEMPDGDEVESEPASEADDGFEDYELDGASYRIPKELKSRLEAGNDYTRKTTDLANTRRAIDLQHKELALHRERQKFDASVADDVKWLDMADSYIKQQEQQDWSRLTDSQRTNSMLELQSLRSRRDDLRNTLGQKWNDFQQGVSAERAKLKQEAETALAKSIPNWSADTRSAIEKYVVGLGYPELQAQNMAVQDYIVANKARLYDELQANKTAVVQKAQQKQAKVIKTTPRNPMPDKVKQQFAFKKALNKATNPSDRTKVLRDRIGEIFNAGR